MSARQVTAIRHEPVTLQAAADAFLSSPRCENANTCRAYATVIEKVIARLGPGRELAQISDSEIARALHALWGEAAASTWNRNRAAVGSWLSWCQTTKRWSAPALASDCERRREHADYTRSLAAKRAHRAFLPPHPRPSASCSSATASRRVDPRWQRFRAPSVLVGDGVYGCYRDRSTPQ